MKTAFPETFQNVLALKMAFCETFCKTDMSFRETLSVSDVSYRFTVEKNLPFLHKTAKGF